MIKIKNSQILYENVYVFQNPVIFPTQGSLSPEQSTLIMRDKKLCNRIECPVNNHSNTN
jgi:hypothetical protein